MTNQDAWVWALVIAAPVCCAGWIAFLAGGLTVGGGWLVWQGAWALAGLVLLLAGGLLLWNARRNARGRGRAGAPVMDPEERP